MQRTATCCCGDLSITTDEEPIKVSACHCRSCQKRTGSAFSVAVFFPEAAVIASGVSASYSRLGDSGFPVEFHFCRRCGSTIYWYPEFRPGWVGVAIGCLDDRSLSPTQAVYEDDRMQWVTIDTTSQKGGASVKEQRT